MTLRRQAVRPPKPTKADLAAAIFKKVPDLIAPRLSVLFVGINPGLYTAAIGYHFGRPGNRFWPALHAGGFTDRVLKPWENSQLLDHGCGITNMVARPTARADELTAEELRAGAISLEKKVRRYQPRFVAIVGITSYRTAFARPTAQLGLQNEKLAGASIWVLPNPSGLNAHYQPADLAKLFRALRNAARSDD
ncbi:MAG: G/U mismatch-specific DNA glycosylase [Phycisphaerae bacterium]|nr:G/U mismatch-specific DNA glycosylase [Phycisphaerae bacterium]